MGLYDERALVRTRVWGGGCVACGNRSAHFRRKKGARRETHALERRDGAGLPGCWGGGGDLAIIAIWRLYLNTHPHPLGEIAPFNS